MALVDPTYPHVIVSVDARALEYLQKRNRTRVARKRRSSCAGERGPAMVDGCVGGRKESDQKSKVDTKGAK